MRKFSKRFFAGLLVAALTITSMYVGPAAMDVHAEEKTATEYEIYPQPHEISYQEGTYDITDAVNVTYDEEIDEATKNRMKKVVESKGKAINSEAADGATNIFVGVYGSENAADAYIEEKYDVDAALFEKFGSYFMASKDGEICILGKDTDGAFYGITSLMHIFNQMDGSTIRNFTMKDYADTNIRGFIEGYYGIPWSNEDRMSLMEFGGQFKMTSYVFAPKDDPYHSSKWRELYPADKLAEIAEMAAVGNASKCKFVWTIHPFRSNAISDATYDADLQIIKAKFEQLYEAGVRQFGVLGDDAGNLPRTVIIRLMNDLQKWVDEKGDVYNLVFCPAGYNHAWQGNYSELNEYDAGFAEDIQIFWTGEAVCQPIEVKTLDHFRKYNLADGQEKRRAPLFWLNWPVNDINMSRLMMGKGSLLHTDIALDDLAGVVTNPMQDAEASKVAIFAVADYAWNVANFDDDESWVDSFKYVEPDATEALYTLAKHMSDPSPNNHGLVLAESEELKPFLDDFMEAYEAGTYDADKAAKLIEEFGIIKKACDDFHKQSNNEKLKEELLPFTNALKDLSDACILLINTAAALKDGNADTIWVNYSNALAKLTASQNYDRPLINNGTKKALPGSKRIMPFANKLNELVSVPVNSIIDDSKLITTFITSRTDTPDGAFEKLTDNNEATEVIWKNPNSTTAETYIGFKYSKAITLNDVTFKMGQSGNPRDTFKSAKLQYTEDGNTWIDIAGSEYTDERNIVTAEGLNLQVKGVRIISTADKTNMWLGCKDIIVNRDSIEEPEEPEQPEFTAEIIRTTENWGVYTGSESNMLDGDLSTSVQFKVRQNMPENNNSMIVGDYVGVKLSRPITLGRIYIAQAATGNDFMKKAAVEYSLNGETWTKIQDCTDAREIDIDVSDQDITAQYVRLVKTVENQGNWLIMREFDVNEKILHNGKVYTNVADYKAYEADYADSLSSIVPVNNIVLANGQYIGLKLERIKDITNINFDAEDADGLTVQTSKNAVVWTDVTGSEYEDARYIRVINNGDAEVTFDLNAFEVESYEITPISIADKNVAFYGGGDGLNAFDKDRTTEAIWNHSQVANDFVTYDLGQVIDLNSLSFVSKDSAGDFPRHAKVSVSKDNKTWKDIMFIGKQDAANEGEQDGTDNIMDVLPIHDVSSNLKTVEDLNEEVRYIKVAITRTKVGADKWTRYTEIELNGGDMFLKSENNPTIITDAQESDNNIATQMIDGDVATTFKPVGNQAGSFTYYISENTTMSKFKILQSPSTVSNAKVTAEVVQDGKVKTVELGTLSQSFNEFDTRAYSHVLSVKVKWAEGSVPTIHEIVASPSADYSAVYAAIADADELTEVDYTEASWAALQAAIDAVVWNLEPAKQADVDAFAAAIQDAIANLEEKPQPADYSAVYAAIAVSKVYVEEQYTAESWAALQAAIEAVNWELTDEKQADVDAFAKAIQNAIAGLALKKEDVPEKIFFTVTVDGKPLGTEYEYNDQVNLILANAVPQDGKEFAGWKVGGKLISTTAEYKFYVSNDVEITSVWVDKDETVEQKAEALMTSVSVAKRADGKSDIKYVAQLVIPKGYKVVDAGLIWSTKETPFIVDGDLNEPALKPTRIKKISDTNQFSVTIKGVPAGYGLRGCAFAYIQKGEEEPILIYSNEAKIQTQK